MRTYIISRLLLAIPTLLIVATVIFFIMRLIPGDVVTMLLGEISYMTGEGMEALRQELGLDVPAHIQYGRWLNGILHGDFGDSLWSRKPVIEVIAPKIPVSLQLGSLAILFSQMIALPVGVFSAIRQDTIGDYVGRGIAILCIALPSFWLGTMVMVYPSVWWGWTPPLEYIPITRDPLASLSQLVLPAILLGMVMSGTTMRLTRTMMLEVLRQDYIRTAWAKGIRERVVVFRHALKNALIPVVTIVGINMPIVISGSIILENIFALPGVGKLLVETITVRDYTVLSGINLIVATFVLVINLIVDLTYAYLDPRIRYG